MGTSIEDVIDSEARDVSQRVLNGTLDEREATLAILELVERSRICDAEGAVVGRKFASRYEQVARDAADAYRDIFVDRVLDPDKGYDFATGATSSLCGALRQLARKSRWVSIGAGRPQSRLREALTDEIELFSTPATDELPDVGLELAVQVPAALRPMAATQALIHREGLTWPVRPASLAERRWLSKRLDEQTAVASLHAFDDLITGCGTPPDHDERLLAIWDSFTIGQIHTLRELDSAFIWLIASYSCRDFVHPSKADLRRMRKAGYAAGPSGARWESTVRRLIDAFLASDTDGLNPQNRRGGKATALHRRNGRPLADALRQAAQHGSKLGETSEEVYESLCGIWFSCCLRMMESGDLKH